MARLSKHLQYTDEDVIFAIRALALNLGRMPIRRDFRLSRWRTIDEWTLTHHFGNVGSALKAADVTIEYFEKWMPTGTRLQEGVSFYSPIEIILDRVLHFQRIEHLHWVFTDQHVGTHRVLIPMIIKTYPNVALVYGPGRLPPWGKTLWASLLSEMGIWAEGKLNAELRIINFDEFADDLMSAVTEGTILPKGAQPKETRHAAGRLAGPTPSKQSRRSGRSQDAG